MSWYQLRLLGVCGVWLAMQTGCGGNPEVAVGDHGVDGRGAAGAGATSAGGTNGGLVIPMGGDDAGGDSSGPTAYVCGNGELEPGEFCDDGNTAAGDGCSGDCEEVDLDYDCSVVGETCVKVVVCGDGILQGGEQCDDMNAVGGDGCSDECRTVDSGWVCVRPGTPCVKVSVCGNGTRERGEECDDGQSPPMSNDGCDDECQIEPGYHCPNPGQSCVQQVCGDGVRTPNEACDDRNVRDGDGCSGLCLVEAGWHCSSAGCKPECGDGLVRGLEACDDGNATGGDGCSSVCNVEPFFSCDQAEPSGCSSSVACGNGKVEPGEICDPPGTDGCKPGCKNFDPMTSNPAVCGNSVIEDAEACDPPAVGSGCSAQCKVENGWTCPQPGVCFKNPACGDNIVQVAQGEGCDPPNVGNGCTASCKVEAGWTCVGLGPSICVKPVCGNGAVDPGEQCDDGSNTATKDGCSGCVIGAGWACPTPGASCIPKCGDGMKVGIEQCDDGNKTSGDGCNTGCKLEAGFTCPTAGAKCVAAVCGDKNVDTGEGCDDGNKVAGDGCGPTCQPEPTVTVGPDPKVNVFCGDGLVTGAEKCDDGNTNDGDGCEHDCTVTKPGWTCTGKVTLPPTLDMRINFRDFKSANALTAGGHPDFQYNTFSQVLGITGDACLTANAATCGRLDAEGKPVLVRTNQQNKATGYNTGTGIMSAGSFGLWYRDTNPTAIAGNNGAIQIKPFTKTLTLVQQGGVNSDVYAYSNGNFYPITAAEGFGNIGGEVAQCNNGAGVRNQANSCNGCDANCMARDYGFTSELRYFFQYKGGERLTFTGDDDVWVYVNGKLAVDLGGLHSQLSGQVVLGDDGNGVVANDSNCSANGVAFAALPDPAGGCYSAAEQADSQDQRFGLTKGGVYEIVLFHAERHSDASNFRLTLAGFLAPRSSCSTICGDGLVAGDEYCDDGPSNSDAISGACNTSCTARAYCGDSVKQLPGEACDNGTNTDLYKTSQSSPTVCAPGCKVPASCGDGALQAAYEQCDKGLQNNDASYGKTSCTTACKLGGYCGDGIPQTSDGEACDLGANNGKTYGPTSCGYDCQPGPRCGDHIRNGGEQCDDGPDNGKATSHCDTDCTIKPYCGDGIKQVGEECDYGQFASTEYGGCTDMCMFGPRCGDGGPGDTPDLEEECDRGTPSNTGGYDGCTNKCTLGPRCGDSITQAAEGEACDNGFNADDYDDPNTPQAECGPDCTLPPHCGDGRLQPAHELCDNGQANDDEAYEGCTTKCDFGPYCGDGNIDVQGGETCDNGRANVSYAAKKGGCSYDCQPAPYCGDAQRNGPEQCDLGAKKNTGAYGGCNADCTFAARCGDGKRQGTEECDDGPSGSLTCSATCKRRVQVQ